MYIVHLLITTCNQMELNFALFVFSHPHPPSEKEKNRKEREQANNTKLTFYSLLTVCMRVRFGLGGRVSKLGVGVGWVSVACLTSSRRMTRKHANYFRATERRAFLPEGF